MADFFFKTTKFHALLLLIPKSLRFLCTLIVLLVSVGVWFLCVYKPLLLSYQRKQAHYISLNSMEKMDSKIEEKNKNIKNLLHKKNRLVHQEKNKISAEKNQSIEDFTHKKITELFTLAHKAGVTINRHTPLESTKSDWFLSFHTTNEFQGSYPSIVNFLQSLSKNCNGIIVTTMTITKQGDASLILSLEYTINQILENNLKTNNENFHEKK